MGWSRRIGVAAAFVLLIGAGIAFAGGALNGGDREPGAPVDRPAGERPPTPSLVAPAVALTRADAIDVAGTLPNIPAQARADKLRVYVNAELVRERGVPEDAEFTLNDVPLQEGENVIQAALVNDAGEGELSAPVTVTLDSTAPAIRISSPDTETPAYSETETLRGRTEPGATLEVREEGGASISTTVADDGAFEAILTLALGQNSFLLRSEDAAGNRSTTRLEVTRATSLASVNLYVSVTELLLAELPATVDVVASIRDEHGAAADGAQVTFSLSPPNRGTTTYRATSTGGEARWTGMPVTGDQRATGTWLVTILAVLPSGEELREDATFSVR